MARFISPSKNLRLVMKPMRRQIVEGVPFLMPGKAIKFSNGVYETDDEKELQFLRNHPVFGRDFFETKIAQPVVEKKAAPEGFMCQECGKMFSSEAGLRAHMRVHDKEGE